MADVRWEEMGVLFERAQALAPQDRAAFVEEQCADERMRRELVSLLRVHDEATCFFKDFADVVLEKGLIALHSTAWPPPPGSDPLNLVGRRVGHYTVDEHIGGGGMGVVYRARDVRLRREVALKFLPPHLAVSEEAEQRFVREARAASALDHPHIATIYDIGRADVGRFIAMAYYEGETLQRKLRRGPLPTEEVLAYAAQIAEALAEAHAAGIVHRDVKPANVLITRQRAVKLLDFGLALSPDQLELTGPGVRLGTIAYMSPEQIEGESIDSRADLWALGATLYEALTGERPFQGDSLAAVMNGILQRQPTSLRKCRDDLSSELESIVDRCLKKDRRERYGSAEDLLEDLRAHQIQGVMREQISDAVGPAQIRVDEASPVTMADGPAHARRAVAPKADRIRSLAVLPFDDLSADGGETYLAAGLQDALIGALSQIDALRVISRTSTLGFRGRTERVPEIAHELNVDAVLEGSVVRVDRRVRIHVQLVQARPEERHMWAEAYERELDEVLALHAEVAHAAAQAIRGHVSPRMEERLAHVRRVKPAMYEAYLRGRFHMNTFTPTGIQRGFAYLHQAIEEDPADPLPYAALALGHSQIGHESGEPATHFPRAKAAAVRALERDDTLAEAHEAIAETKLYWEWDWEGAEEAFARTLELNPNLAVAHAHRAWYLHLRRRWEEGLAEMRQAEELDPLVPLFPAWYGWQLLLLGRGEEALTAARRSLELQADFPVGLYVLGSTRAAQGHFDEAIDAHERAREVSPGWAWGLGHTLALMGLDKEARKVAADMEEDPSPMTPFGLGAIYAEIGDLDEAFRWLEIALESRFSWVPWLAVYPLTSSPFYDDPRCERMIRRLNLPDPWKPPTLPLDGT